jgi:hypothetical protein
MLSQPYARMAKLRGTENQKWLEVPSPISPATVESSREEHSLATGASPMAETDTRGGRQGAVVRPRVGRALEPSIVVRKGSKRWVC